VPTTPASERPTAWWLSTLKRRAERIQGDYLKLDEPIRFANEAEQKAAVKFFNAALRAEESGLRQAHELANEVAEWDPALAEVLRLYGNEEGWHRELLTEFLAFIGGEIQPMGRVTRFFYRLYGRARRMETIVLTNLMFETIGSTTYRMALANVEQPAARQMLTILTRDEAFHVPLNVHFLERILERKSAWERARLRLIHRVLFVGLLALPLASRPKAAAFDRIGTRALMRGYARTLGSLFVQRPELGLGAPRLLLAALGLGRADLKRETLLAIDADAAARAAERQSVHVTALRDSR
jgi:hypothetical protein